MARSIHLLPPEYRSGVQPLNGEDRIRSLCNEIGHLQAEVKRLHGLLEYKDNALLSVVSFFEDILANNNPQSVEGLRRWVSRLRGAVERQEPGMLE